MDTPMIGKLSREAREALVDQHVFPRRLGRSDEFAALVRFAMETTMLNGEVVRLDAAARLPNA
jgi:3-hydroxyacyl-CoA dehydrogenase/3-hydroxy-2-methylbutyryl-CoA dehydrogenase